MRQSLPAFLKPLFWEYDFRKLSWDSSRDLVIARVLSDGSWDQLRWLRKRLSEDELRAWIVQRRGHGLGVKQLHYWRIKLNLPRRDVERWLASPGRRIWDRRLHNGHSI
jgi:hypothetical protein